MTDLRAHCDARHGLVVIGERNITADLLNHELVAWHLREHAQHCDHLQTEFPTEPKEAPDGP